MFFEAPVRRPLRRPSPRSVAGVAIVLAAGAAVAALLTRDSPPEPPSAVPAGRAEVRLEHQLGSGGVGPPGSVGCPSSIRPGRTTRCEFRYPDGDTQLMLVSLTTQGELDIEVPYPAQRRPGG